MKAKITLLSILFVLSVGIASAQDYHSAIGLRLGYPLSISYKTFIKGSNALELTVGYRSWPGYNRFNIGGYYEHHTAIESAKGLMWYYGAGANIYFWSFDNGFRNGADYSSTSVGLSGVLGLDYKFTDAPINLSLDWIPTFFLNGYGDSFGAGYGGLAVRYTIN